jgi:hypothetical protein
MINYENYSPLQIKNALNKIIEIKTDRIGLYKTTINDFDIKKTYCPCFNRDQHKTYDNDKLLETNYHYINLIDNFGRINYMLLCHDFHYQLFIEELAIIDKTINDNLIQKNISQRLDELTRSVKYLVAIADKSEIIQSVDKLVEMIKIS